MNSSWKTSLRAKRRISCSQIAVGALAAVVMLGICGCGDFFAQKPAELQTEVILNELKEVKESPHIENPLPEMYRGPAKRVKVKDGIKLFYFTKHHTVDKLSGLITQQLGNKVSLSSPTNQLIIHCANDDGADKVLEFLKMVDVPPIQVNIDCLILERFADVTMDWETTIYIENLLGEKITFGGKTDDAGELLPAFPGASLRESKRSTFGLDVGYWKNKGIAGHEFRAVVDMLISTGYLKILMNPTLETINGKKAKITIRDYAPIEKIVTKEGVEPYSLTEYKWVEDSLEVTPYVFADGSIGLSTRIQLGSKSKPEGVVQTSIITERTIEVEENRIKPGDSLIIGGIRKTEERVVIRGVPFLKDIPILNILFSSKDFEEKATEVIFILTPSISSGGVEHAEMIKDIREKYAPPEYKMGLHDVLTDPFGGSIYTEHVKQKAAQAEFERLKAELEKAEAAGEVEQIKKKLLKAAEEILVEKQKVIKAIRQAQTAKQQADKAKAEASKAEAEAKKAKAKAEAESKARVEAEAKAEAESRKAKEAGQAQPDAEHENNKINAPQEN